MVKKIFFNDIPSVAALLTYFIFLESSVLAQPVGHFAESIAPGYTSTTPPTPTPTPTPPPTPPTPPPPPPPGSCPALPTYWYIAETGYNGNYDHTHPAYVSLTTEATQSLSCLVDKFNSTYAQCLELQNAGSLAAGYQVTYSNNMRINPMVFYDWYSTYSTISPPITNCHAIEIEWELGIFAGYEGSSEIYYLDNNCNLIDYTLVNVEQSCAALSTVWNYCPISLLWDSPETFDTENSIVDFELGPKNSEAKYLWKASGKHPLLVYDPKHEGKIDSAEQIFGQWTFGGQKSALMSENTLVDKLNGESKPWSNGYDALAILDLDKSNAIDGKELEPLALWFDKNQDGASQAGEVISASTAGLTKVFYKPDHKDPITGDLYVKNGFERIIEGEKVLGTSVDWFSEGALTATEILAKQAIKSSLSNPHLRTDQKPMTSSSQYSRKMPVGYDEKARAYKDTEIHIWSWNAIAKSNKKSANKGESPHGFLILKVANDNTITGEAVVEAKLNEQFAKIEDLKGMMSIAPIEGKKSKDLNGNDYFEFTIRSKNNVTYTKATLSNDKKSVAGESSVSLASLNSSVQDKEKRIKFEWVGKPLADKVIRSR